MMFNDAEQTIWLKLIQFSIQEFYQPFHPKIMPSFVPTRRSLIFDVWSPSHDFVPFFFIVHDFLCDFEPWFKVPETLGL